MTVDVAIECREVTRRFELRQGRRTTSEVVALDGVSLQLPRGQLVALAGPSGSGKSTLLSLLGALDRPSAGTVRVDGVDVPGLGRRARRAFRRRTAVTMLPQPADNLLLGETGRRNVEAALRHRLQLGDRARMAQEVLELLDLVHFADRPAMALSGGEQQRIALACCLAGNARVVLADEPTGALDRASAATVVAALRLASAGGRATVVVATHDDDVIRAADTVIRLDHGRRVW